MRFARGYVRGHVASHKNDHRPFVAALQGFAVVRASKNQLSRDFRSGSIFEFCNSIRQKRSLHIAHHEESDGDHSTPAPS